MTPTAPLTPQAVPPITATQHTEFMLPPAVISKADLARLVTELEWVDNDLTAYAIRAKNGADVHMPTLSQGLGDFLVQNKLQITETRTRAAIIAQLRVLKNKAPILHMTFAVSADRQSLQHIIEWLRREVHPQALITVGLQPDLVAGVYMRTPNHVHDFSLRAALNGRHDLLTANLESLRAGVKPE